MGLADGAVALIDYGAGNLHSVRSALAAAGGDRIVVTADPDVVARARRIVLPGVGAFGASMAGLSAIDGLVDAIRARVLGDGAPFLGICVGMQLLADAGHEHGDHRGLGWIGGQVVPLTPADPAARLPHMGWNDVAATGDHPVIQRGEAYFLHGFHLTGVDPARVAATSDHGGPFIAAVAHGPVIGVQVHPEKSQAYGLSLLQRFLSWTP